jgi:hypothetical protein
MHKNASLALALGLMAVSGYGVIAAWSWPWKAALFPLAIGVPLFVMSAAEAAWAMWGETERAAEAEGEALRRTALAAAWIVGFFAAILLFGFPLAVPLFVFLYLKVQANESWTLSAATTALAWGIFYGLFDRLLHLPFPAGWLIAF